MGAASLLGYARPLQAVVSSNDSSSITATLPSETLHSEAFTSELTADDGIRSAVLTIRD